MVLHPGEEPAAQRPDQHRAEPTAGRAAGWSSPPGPGPALCPPPPGRPGGSAGGPGVVDRWQLHVLGADGDPGPPEVVRHADPKAVPE